MENKSSRLFSSDQHYCKINGIIKKLVDKSWDSNEISDLQNLMIFMRQIKSRYHSSSEHQLLATENQKLIDQLPKPLEPLNLLRSNFSPDQIVFALISYGSTLLKETSFSENKFYIILSQLLQFKVNLNENIHAKQFLNSVWLNTNLLQSDLKLLEFLCDLHPAFIEKKIDEIITRSTENDVFDKLLLINDKIYYEFIQFVMRSAVIFQAIVEVIKDQMKSRDFPPNLQEFLNVFLTDLMEYLNLNTLVQYYPEDIMKFVSLLSADREYEDLNQLLREFKTRNYDRFIILVTHFPKYLHLLK